MPERFAEPMRDGGGRRLSRMVLFKQRALALYERYRFTFESDREFCDAVGLNYEYFRKLRSQNKPFKEAIERFDAAAENGITHDKLALANAQRRWPHLELWKGLFLELYRSERDRMAAADLVDRTWRQIKDALDADADFREGYEEIEEEIQVRAEDRKKRDAIAGKGSSTEKYLEARGSDLSKNPQGKKGKDKAAGSAAAAYAALIASKAVPAPPAESDRDVPEEATEGLSDALAVAGSEVAPS